MRMDRRLTRRSIEALRENNSARRIARTFRFFQIRNRPARRMAFIINPYDNVLDLKDKHDIKLFQEGSKGLKETDKFSGKKVDYSNFEKLMGKSFDDVRVMEALMIPTIWDTSNANAALQKVPTEEGLLDLFTTHKLSKSQVKSKSNLVWASTAHGADTPKYFARFTTAATDDATLDAERNKMRLKHVMMGKKIWDSLSSEFQIDIMGSSGEFKYQGEYDGPTLWYFIRARVKPSTKVGASKLKERIEKKELRDFDDDVTKFNTWFTDTRTSIRREEGEGYNEYLRQLFRAYLGCDNDKFKVAVEEEQRAWIQGKLSDDYSHEHLMDLGRVTFNNLVENDDWQTGRRSSDKRPAKDKEEKNFLALATEILKKFGDQSGKNHNGGASREKATSQPGERTYKAWRTENPNKEKEKIVKGTKMKWCTNDCHDQPMWCGRKNCLGREDFKTMMDKRSGKESERVSETKIGASDDFKIALAAMVSPEDLETLTSQFLKD